MQHPMPTALPWSATPSGHHGIRAEAERLRLERLLPALAFTVATGVDLQHLILRGLHRALRAERRRGRAGHWSYDLDRHVALVLCLRSELARARALRGRSWTVQNAVARTGP